MNGRPLTDGDITLIKEALPSRMVEYLARVLLGPPQKYALDEWAALDLLLERRATKAKRLERQSGARCRDMNVGTPGSPRIPSITEQEDMATFAESLDAVLHSFRAEEQLRLLLALQALKDHWVALTGDPERLTGHLMLAHGADVEAASLDADRLILAHYRSHGSGSLALDHAKRPDDSGKSP